MNNENTLKTIEEHVKAISDLLEIPLTESNRDTPKRVAKMLANELFSSRNDLGIEDLKAKMTMFNADGHSTPIIIKDVPFSSMCEHHWLPFFGTVNVKYIPKDKIIGLSKIPRVIRYFSRRPQLQERFTDEIGEFLVEILNPKMLVVEVTAKHTCVMCRGAESDCETETFFEYSMDCKKDTGENK